ncbi:uncharacterized protein LOC124613261 [Schistocerca americana]|uniref:uncharacterized protein LOC124613261 n=1 Tax=Schistocerca americana TaxID=7009 RepID=UPI001F4FFA56|nr:uncharacterized protein LOC124613261 [Schistocerca americana]
MSWRWQVNNPQQIATLLTLQQQQQQQQQQQRQQQQQQLPIRDAELCSDRQQGDLLGWRSSSLGIAPTWTLAQAAEWPVSVVVAAAAAAAAEAAAAAAAAAAAVAVAACAAQRELYEDTLQARNTRRTTHNDNRHSVLYHEGKGNDFPFHETRTEVFHPGHRNRRLLNEVYEAQSGLYNEVLPTRNVQPATDTDYRHNGLYYKKLQNRFPYHDDRSEIFLTEEKQRRFLDESNEFRRRMWRAQESCSTFERQHEYHRSPRDRSVGPDQR